jgi:hypothetical protein
MPSALGLAGQEKVPLAACRAVACADGRASAPTGSASIADEPWASSLDTFGGTSEAVANLAGLAGETARSSAGRAIFRVSSTAGADFDTDVEPLGTELPRQKKVPKPAPIASAQAIAITRMTIHFSRGPTPQPETPYTAGLK